jgi:superfamily II DNA helicase RecQ
MLKLMFRRNDVQLRAHQSEVLEAMGMGGQVVSVVGVGGGKTVAFALPAFAQQDGITVVIQPLKPLSPTRHQKVTQRLGIDGASLLSGN